MSESLQIDRKVTGEVVVVTLKGMITEDSPIEDLKKDLKPFVIFDLAGVERINSYGIRQWINIMKEIHMQAKQVVFTRCPPMLIEQFNMISNFGGGGVVYSFYLPYYSEKDDKEVKLLFAIPEGKSPETMPDPVSVAKAQGKSDLEFNDVEDEYFYFLAHQKGKSVDPAPLAIVKTIS